MLKNLYIKNFVIVRELNLVLTNGLIVLTGETGVGKSVVAGAINIVMISENDLFFRKEISKNYVSKSFINGRRAKAFA